MDIRLIREFLVLSNSRNYRVAAELLFISQSALSKHIKALEDELGTQLFSRDTKSVSITESGKRFKEHAQVIIDEYDLALGELAGKEIVQGSIKIGGAIRFPEVNQSLYRAVSAFEERYPDVKIIIEDIQWEDYRERLLYNSYDIIVSLRPPNMNEEGLVLQDFYTTDLCVWVSENSAIAKKGTVTFEELSHLNMRFLSPHESQTYTSYARQLFTRRNLSVRVGKPLTQVFSMDGNDFGITPSFSPTENFGSGAKACKIEESDSLPLAIVRKERAPNSLALLFFEVFKRVNCLL